MGITDLEGMEIGVDVGGNALDIMLSPGQAGTAKSEVSAHRSWDNMCSTCNTLASWWFLWKAEWTHFRVYSAGFLEITLTFMAGCYPGSRHPRWGKLGGDRGGGSPGSR